MPEPAATDPFEQAKTLFFDGLACFGARRFADAEQHFLASLALVPGRLTTLVNLAATRLALSRPQEALAAADQVLAVEPENRDAWIHRASALGDLGRHEEALAGFEKLLALDGALGEGWLRHGQTLQSLNRHDEALVSYERALAIDPKLARAWSNLGGILREARRLDEAAHAYEQAIAHGGNAELNGYYLASIRGRNTPTTAPKRYVQPLFDEYAGEFDEHLVQVLHYRAHKVLVGHLQGLNVRRFRSALDLGCGTGLCGPLVKPLAERLAGVDLSDRMLDKARALGLYERLVHADITDYLNTTDERFDLVLAADVFIYIGDLAPVFAAVHRVMESAGVFCFSAELTSSESHDFELLPSLRYAQSERYVRELAARHGFEVARLLREPVREDQRQSIDGMFVYLTRR
ncbi:MAG: methyltransferase domain-containing protein [Methylibium sp.]|uniref:methyltransferase domain-containing protein n=1 Tax=Methylibium sp. TaxID=2067992 RepID=UPI001810B4DC|nr:methyltransferase domain-containing protein [Methylibium sp.]MBA3597126.1 methyltransferase domain-containing protein [Methylibium sp.]